MKRYRFLDFFIDTERKLWELAANNPEFTGIEQRQLTQEIIAEYGLLNIEAKKKRYMEIKPPVLCIVLEYYPLIYETIRTYIAGQYYPALTGACCIGETILNSLLLKLRNHYSNTNYYKQIYKKDSFQNWEESIEILESWKILTVPIKKEYLKLLELRKISVHLREITDFSALSCQAINIVLTIVDHLFGLKSNVFFSCPGEIYIKKPLEKDPIVIEFFKPACAYVGYKHRIVNVNNSTPFTLGYEDTNDYEQKALSDEEFKELRISFREAVKGL
jgi:hypothetical protein